MDQGKRLIAHGDAVYQQSVASSKCAVDRAAWVMMRSYGTSDSLYEILSNLLASRMACAGLIRRGLMGQRKADLCTDRSEFSALK
jgi:hypothetical protein